MKRNNLVSFQASLPEEIIKKAVEYDTENGGSGQIVRGIRAFLHFGLYKCPQTPFVFKKQRGATKSLFLYLLAPQKKAVEDLAVSASVKLVDAFIFYLNKGIQEWERSKNEQV